MLDRLKVNCTLATKALPHVSGTYKKKTDVYKFTRGYVMQTVNNDNDLVITP